jgi:sugar phosphate isomerase/epimerase
MLPGVVGMLPNDPAEITTAHARAIRALGFVGASVMLLDPDSVDPATLRRARQVLADEGVAVVQANARYPSLVSDDPARRAEGVRLASRACHGARILEADFLLIRPGSLNLGGDWRPHPANHTGATEARLIESLTAVAHAATGEGVTIGLECGAISPLDSPARVRRVIDAVGSSALRYNCDPVNFAATFSMAYDTAALMAEITAHLANHVVCAHVKDLRVVDGMPIRVEECAPGEGIFDFPAFFRAYESVRPNGFALIEHLPDDRIPAAKRAVDAILEGMGWHWSI